MEQIIKIRKGLDLNLAGKAERKTIVASMAETYALVPDDFYGVKPRMVCKEGDTVEAGSPLFVDKKTERINFVSPVSGIVTKIERGERRKILSIQIQADKEIRYKEFEPLDLDKCSSKDIKNSLLDAGLFAFFKSRPYDVVANPNDRPKGIFISGFSKMPLAADFSHVLKGHEIDFQVGVTALSKLSTVYLGVSKEQVTELGNIENAKVSIFDGPNPSGCVGVQINHISPINKGEIVWTLGAEEVIFIGHFIASGQVDLTRTIAVAGSKMKTPCYEKVIVGAQLSSFLAEQLTEKSDVRIINGNPFVGKKATLQDFLSAHTTEVCAIEEGADKDEMLGWILPRLNDYSTNRSYFSWLFGKKHAFNLDCRVKGGERNIIMSGEYDNVFPMDIYANYLIKAIITGDIDRQEALGIYEVAPEDFAVAEFVDSSKLELQRIVREGLDVLRKENE